MSLVGAGLSYLYVFLQSAGLEALFLRATERRQLPTRFWSKIFLMNAITHPLVVYGWLADGWMTNLQAVILAEAFAVLSETFFLRRILKNTSWSRAFALSLAANLLSWQVAPLLTWSFVKLFR
ncbi:MAG TPA: hypothetical protein VM901_07280 [Bdellovibrionota bacterium]|nr:hypothetical protein [Bdellovibrionota bacterium]